MCIVLPCDSLPYIYWKNCRSRNANQILYPNYPTQCTIYDQLLKVLGESINVSIFFITQGRLLIPKVMCILQENDKSVEFFNVSFQHGINFPIPAQYKRQNSTDIVQSTKQSFNREHCADSRGIYNQTLSNFIPK